MDKFLKNTEKDGERTMASNTRQYSYCVFIILCKFNAYLAFSRRLFSKFLSYFTELEKVWGENEI